MSEELAARCERADGPDRELDAAIHEAVTTFPARLGGPGWPDGALVVPVFPGWALLPAYTASIDAAMALVPEGFDWILGSTNGGLTIHAEVGGRGHDFMRFGATPALALCSAALKARQL